MNDTALIMIGMTNILLVLVLGGLGFLVYRLMKQKSDQAVKTQTNIPPVENFHPAIVERIKGLDKLRPRRQDLFCPNHPEEPGEAPCGICERLFCSLCIKPFKAMHLCKEHFPLVMKNNWDEVLTLLTSTEDPEQGVILYDQKKKMYEEKNIPTYIETHYKINVDQDYVETYLVLFALKSDVSAVKDELLNLSSMYRESSP